MTQALWSYSLQVMLSCQMLVQAAELQFCSLFAGSTLSVLAQYVSVNTTPSFQCQSQGGSC